MPPSQGPFAAGRTVRIACAADDDYVMPLAVTLHTAAKNLGPGFSLEVFLLSGQISDGSRIRLVETLAELPVDLRWIDVDASYVDDLPVSYHISHVAYYRLLLARALPTELDRVLYLDSDLLVFGDLAEIWSLPFDGARCYAVQDIACPVIDAGALTRLRDARPYLNKRCPIPNYRELGLTADAAYFNSGVLLIDLAFWRDEDLWLDFIDCLRTHARHVFCWDQYALNVVLAGRWRPLPLQWNQGTHIYEFPSDEYSPVDRAQFLSMRDDPKIVHFTSPSKPWQFGNAHPYRDAFFEALDETAWAGWRPARPAFSLQRWWMFTSMSLHRRMMTAYLKVLNLLSIR